ncbi:MAG: ATP-binding protein [Saprospiraceae bacterium]
MSESQNIEYKASWIDEYLKWICGFENANDGTIFIGKDDEGKVFGQSKDSVSYFFVILIGYVDCN